MTIRIGLTRDQVEEAIADYLDRNLNMDADKDSFEFEAVCETSGGEIAVHLIASLTDADDQEGGQR